MSRRALERVWPGMTISCSQLSSEDRTKESFSGGDSKEDHREVGGEVREERAVCQLQFREEVLRNVTRVHSGEGSSQVPKCVLIRLNYNFKVTNFACASRQIRLLSCMTCSLVPM